MKQRTKETVETKPRPIPMLDLRRQYATIKKDVLEALDRVCESQHLIMGEDVAAFERECSSFFSAKHALGCASGTDALWLALAALEVGPNDAVVTTPFTFFATVSSITRVGARPVLADIDPLTLNLAPSATEKALRKTPNAKAIIPVHLYGQCADMDALNAIAKNAKCAVLEDAAQAFGASWKGKRAGSLGDIASFSFYPTKNLSAFGDGGMVSTNDDRLAERCTMLRAHGSRARYYHDEIGWNSRLDSVQASVLRVKLKHIEKWNDARRGKASFYDVLLNDAGLVHDSASSIVTAETPVQLPGIRDEAYHVFHQYVIRVHRRDELRKFLAERGIGSEVYYPLPLHLQKCFAFLGYKEGDFPESERAAREVLALPIFPELREDEQRAVVSAIAEFYS